MADLSVVVKAVDKASKTINAVRGKFKKFERSVTSSFNKIATVQRAVYAAATGYAIKRTIDLGNTMLDASKKMTAIDNAMRASVLNVDQYTDSMQFLREMTNEAGLDFASTAQSYNQFAAAMLRTGTSLSAVQGSFDDISKAAVSMQLPAERTELVFMALSQMASKGVVSMEELRRQLGDSLPGAVQIGAKAMNMTNQEFMKLVSTGKVLSSEFIPKFAKQVKEELGGSFDSAKNSILAAQNRMSNAFFDLKVSIGQAIEPGVLKLFNQLQEDFTRMVDEGEGVAEIAGKVADKLVDMYEAVKKVVQFIVDNKETLYWAGYTIAAFKAAQAINGITIALQGMAAHPIVASVIALGAGLNKIFDIVEQNQDTRMSNIINANESKVFVTTLKELGGAYSELEFKQKTYNRELKKLSGLDRSAFSVGSKEAHALAKAQQDVNSILGDIGKNYGKTMREMYDTQEEYNTNYQILMQARAATARKTAQSEIEAAEASKNAQDVVDELTSKKAGDTETKKDTRTVDDILGRYGGLSKMAIDQAKENGEKLLEDQQPIIDEGIQKKEAFLKYAEEYHDKLYRSEQMLREKQIQTIGDESERELEAHRHKWEKIESEYEGHEAAIKNIRAAAAAERYQLQRKIAAMEQQEIERANKALVQSTVSASQQIISTLMADGRQKKSILTALAIANGAYTAVLAWQRAFETNKNVYAAIATGIAASAQVTAATIANVVAIQRTKFAMGTKNAPGGYSIVGEHGPELAYIPQGSTVNTYNQSKDIMNKSETKQTYNTYNVSLMLSEESLVKTFTDAMRNGKADDFIREQKMAMI